MLSLINFIQELEANGYYSCGFDFNGTLIKEEGIFKFTGIENIFKLQQITSFTKDKYSKYSKIESDLIKSTDKIIS